MAQTRKTAKRAFDPLTGQLVAVYETSSARLREKLRHPYKWCFCELCWRSTEFATALEAQTVFKRIRGGKTATVVPLTDSIRAKAMKEADALVIRYQEAQAGLHGPYEQGRMLHTYCDLVEMRGDRSTAAFRDQAERLMLTITWAQCGNMSSSVRLPKQPEKAPKPSKLYCIEHNPRRSIKARRAYQRDQVGVAEYEELIRAIWAVEAHELPTWDIEAHAYVRRKAYRQIQSIKAPTRLIGELLSRGASSQAEIARQLGVSRQAVSAAIKRQKNAAA